MKLLKYSFLILITFNIYSQQGWFWQNPLPQGNALGKAFISGNDGYIIGHLGTFLKTTNLGLNWIAQSNIPFFELKSSQFFDLNNIYLVTDNSYLMKSSNGGVNWSTLPILTGETPYVNFIDLQTGYALTHSSISNFSGTWTLYKTTNAGFSWNLNKIDSSANVWSFHFPTLQTGYAVGRVNSPLNMAKIFKTTNGGVIWDSIHTGIRADARNVYFVNDQTGFISTYHPGYKLYRTTNGFQSWDSVYSMSNTSSFYFINESTGYAYDSYTKIKTTNSGLNWFAVQLPTNGIYFNSTGTGFATGVTGEIYKTTNDGLNWNNYTSTVYSNGLLNDIFVINENIAYIACDNGKILKTTNGGFNWIAFTDSQTDFFNSIHFFDENTGIAGVYPLNATSRIKKTTNGGINWYSVNISTTDQITDIDFPNDSTGFAVSKVGYFTRSTDGGESWQTPVFISPIWSGDIKFINSNTGFWVGDNIIRKTTNSGSNWVQTIIDSLDGFSCIDFVDLNTGFVTAFSQPNGNYMGAVLKTTNSGLDWARTDLPVSRIYEIKITDNEVVYAVCDGGKILKSTNMGNTWSIHQSCYSGTLLTMDFTTSLTGYAAGMNGTIIKTTNGGGDPIGIEPISNTMPSEFRLYQNYPNPFNPVTKIKFSIPVNSQSDPVNIFVYDVTGREVKNYQLGSLKAGVYSIDFDGTNLASGVYFYRLVTNRFHQTSKMVLLK